MSINKPWPGNTDVFKSCPDDSILLAYTRQQLDNGITERVRQHIDRCQSCRQKYNAYVSINTKLKVLSPMPRYQFYPERSTETIYQAILQSVQQEEEKRKNQAGKWSIGALLAYPRSRGLQSARGNSKYISFRLLSLPVALVLVALCLIIAVLALAFVFRLNLPYKLTQSNGLRNTGTYSSVVMAHNETPTPGVRPSQVVTAPPTTTGAPGGSSQTPTATLISQPTIVECSTPDDITQHILRICGTNFTPGDKVTLVVDLPPNAPKQVHPTSVDDLGTFVYTFTIYKCRVPVAIYAQDLTNRSIVSEVLHDINYGNCPATTPTPSSEGNNQIKH